MIEVLLCEERIAAFLKDVELEIEGLYPSEGVREGFFRELRRITSEQVRFYLNALLSREEFSRLDWFYSSGRYYHCQAILRAYVPDISSRTKPFLRSIREDLVTQGRRGGSSAVMSVS